MAPTILGLMDHYLPGFKAGGPVRSVEALVETLGSEFSFRIACRDRDLGDSAAYPGVEAGEWYSLGRGKVTYLDASRLGFRAMRALLRETPHDVLYLNSLFSPRMTLIPLLLRRLRLVPVSPVVLAPRGELHPGALRAPRKWRMSPAGRWVGQVVQSGATKKLYIAVGRALGLFRGVIWQATAAGERTDIAQHFGEGSHILTATDLVLPPPALGPRQSEPKRPGRLQAVYVSRIHPKKNLEGTIAAFSRLEGEVELNIYGPIDDAAYWARCSRQLRQLPANVRWSYHGAIPHQQVARVLRDHDVFLLSTWGENFGHVIVEALLAGCPVLISDCTPWVGVERDGAGWDYPPEDTAAFQRALQRLLQMDEMEHHRWSASAAALGRRIAFDAQAVERNRSLFLGALPTEMQEALAAGTRTAPPARSEIRLEFAGRTSGSPQPVQGGDASAD
jgi:glycosyltransferase involved in cell wall biosynthesis